MTALLTDNLPLLAGAPNGIKKLRELILELAVRGKLVPQDPNDEPASELLKCIAEEKAQLVAEGKIKKAKATREELAEVSYEIPSSWAVASLGQVVEIVRGITFPASEKSKEPEPGRVACLRTANVQDKIEWNDLLYIRESFVSRHAQYVEPHDIVMSMANSRELVGKVALIGAELKQKTTFGGFLGVLRPVLIEPRFVMALLRTPHARSALIDSASQTTNIANVSLAKLRPLPFAIPPLAEQHRIVAKVDELMALCDRLEAQQADADSAHAQLVQALLGGLTQARDAEDFAQSWQRLAEHFHTLFSTEPSIDALKQTLLQLAVMGKLVPQAITDEVNGELPAGWSSYKIGEFCTVQGGIQKTPLRRPVSQHFPYLRVANVQRGRIDVRELERYELSLNELEKWRLNAGDLLIVEGNGSESEIGRCAIWQGEVDDCVYQNHLMRVRPQICKQVEYLALYLNSPIGIAHMKRLAITTSGLFNLSVGKIRSIPVALPPLEEQHRIVAKVDQLMALCDQLKARLNQARQVHEHLANALVENALNADRQQTLVITDRKVARTLLAAEITHQLHGLKTFGQRKLQKVFYLAEHAAKITDIQGSYLRDAAGPHDRQLMDQVERELHSRQWYERIERDPVGHAYRPLAGAGQHRPEYERAWSPAERAAIQQVIALMRGWDTDRCERVVTLYAAWNDFLLEGKSVTDEMLVHEVMYSWNDTKLRFTEAQWRDELADMKQQKLLTPTGFGKRTQGGLQTLPGLH